MNCIETRKQLDAWVDGEMSTETADRITRHLKGCPACRLEAERLERIVAALDELPPKAAPAGLSCKTLRAFRAGMEKPGMADWWRELTLSMRSAICGVTLAGLLCGAVLSTSFTTPGPQGNANPYQSLYAGKGFLP